MTKEETIELMNDYGRGGIPFLFVISYDSEKSYVWCLDDINADEILYQVGLNTNIPSMMKVDMPETITWHYEPETPDEYRRRFDVVRRNILKGNSYLVNLTSRVPVETNLSMKDIMLLSKAKYRVWMKDKLVCFSPETFLQIDNGVISCCPMKGTVNADDENALQALMDDEKEAAEHATVVDLIRNDLSMVATGVKVEKYRYAELLKTNCGSMYETSSRITGVLPGNYGEHIGDILFRQLPAGSITGAPKPKTMEIIRSAENFDRGFYTGVMGIYADGCLDSGVMIRFIDIENGKTYFKAGGGVTAKSDWRKEYDETIEKIYVPVY
jgi:para-aminobenzoate synthetase component 1